MLICNRKFQKKRIKKLTRIYYCKDLNELEVNFANWNFALQFSRFSEIRKKSPEFGFDFSEIYEMAQTQTAKKYKYSLTRIFIANITKYSAFCNCNPACSRQILIYFTCTWLGRYMSGIFFLMILLVKRPILYKYFHSIKFCQENLGQNHHLTKNVPVFWALFCNSKKSCHVYKFTGISSHQNPQKFVSAWIMLCETAALAEFELIGTRKRPGISKLFCLGRFSLICSDVMGQLLNLYT